MSDDPHRKDLHSLDGGFHDYLGDGVYVHFDGHQIWLAANHHLNKVIALEPGAVGKLVAYKKRLQAALADRAKGGT